MTTLKLVQLPVPPPAAFAASGNVPLAAGCLGVAALGAGLGARGLKLEVVAPALTDTLGDAALADHLAQDEPALLGLSVYLWNLERSLHLAREVRRRSPRTQILLGGPEVSGDNPFLARHADAFDFAIAGEAEGALVEFLARRLSGRSVEDLPGLALSRGGRLTAFNPQAPPTVPLSTYPSPYLEGLLPIEPDRPSYVETVRGCRSRCAYCFYPRSSPNVRALEPRDALTLVAALRDGGAREVTFLDPTFNHRPDFEPFLAGLVALNRDRRLTFFAEVRAEGLTRAEEAQLVKAGFDRLEIGIQSVNPATLKRIGRGGRPKDALALASRLVQEGVDVLVDLVVGLPGDTEDDVRRGLDQLARHGLAEHAQLFPLLLLPGTALRARAKAEGLVFDEAPPYRVRRTETLDEEALVGLLSEAEELLDRRLDEYPRPHLVHPSPAGLPDVLWLNLDGPPDEALREAARPACAHVALWCEARDLLARLALLLKALDARLSTDPYATLDVVLRPGLPFPLDVLDKLRLTLAAATPFYLTRALSHRGEDMARRLTVSLARGARFDPEWVETVMTEVPVFVDQTVEEALVEPESLGDERPAARLLEAEVSEADWAALKEQVNPESLCFADRALERRWTFEALEYGPA